MEALDATRSWSVAFGITTGDRSTYCHQGIGGRFAEDRL